MFIHSKFIEKRQAFLLLWLLEFLIPVDGTWERPLSLALDRVLLAWEGGNE